MDLDETLPVRANDTLDPADWEAFRTQAHGMLDDMLDFIANARARPVWQPIPSTVRASVQEPLPRAPTALADVHAQFMTAVLPYAVGNSHPGFMGWVHGGGSPVGMLAEMLAAGLNANLGGRDQMPIEVERQIARWCAELFGFPATASGVFVTGTSMANLMAVWIARTAALGPAVRSEGLAVADAPLCAYASVAAHGCVRQAMELAGLGSMALRRIPVEADFRISISALTAAIATDRQAGRRPFLIVGTAGTVDVGAIDDLAALAALARQEKLWFHVDGAFGALLRLSPALAPRVAGIEAADSIAFDFHKWAQVPYDAGFILVREGERHAETFASPAAYLQRAARGLAGGSPWPCDFGPDLSRGFRALKTWFTLKTYGADHLGRIIAHTCALAALLARRIEATPELELLAPVSLNIVCFRYRCTDADRVNADIVADLHERGRVAPSSTLINGVFAIRAAIVNHRTHAEDIEALVAETLAAGRARSH